PPSATWAAVRSRVNTRSPLPVGFAANLWTTASLAVGLASTSAPRAIAYAPRRGGGQGGRVAWVALEAQRREIGRGVRLWRQSACRPVGRWCSCPVPAAPDRT